MGLVLPAGVHGQSCFSSEKGLSAAVPGRKAERQTDNRQGRMGEEGKDHAEHFRCVRQGALFLGQQALFSVNPKPGGIGPKRPCGLYWREADRPQWHSLIGDKATWGRVPCLVLHPISP